MKEVLRVLMFLPLLLVLALPASASSVEEIVEQQEQAADVDELERSAKKHGGIVDYGVSLEDGLAELLDTGSAEIRSVIKRAVRSGVLLLLILILCSLGETMQDSFGKSKVPVVPLAGALAVTAVAAADVDSLLGLGSGAIDHMASFANVLLPTVAAVTAATGAITGAAVRQMAAVLFCDLLVNLIDRLLIPAMYGYIALSVAHAALGNDGLKRMAGMLKWVTTTVLTVVMLAFVSYLTLSGVVAGGADAATIKATKFAISSAIPVVGGILSDAAETILASAGILKGTVGVFGTLTILGICLVPLLRMAVHYLVYKLVSALSSTMGASKVCALVDQIGGAFGLLMGMTGACCLLLLIALVSSVSVVSV